MTINFQKNEIFLKLGLINGLLFKNQITYNIIVIYNVLWQRQAIENAKRYPKRKQRCFDTEPFFADIRHNHHFKRFMLRGIEKVSIET